MAVKDRVAVVPFLEFVFGRERYAELITGTASKLLPPNFPAGPPFEVLVADSDGREVVYYDGTKSVTRGRRELVLGLLMFYVTFRAGRRTVTVVVDATT